MTDHDEIFDNQLPESLEAELESARILKVKPIRPEDMEFDDVINLGTIKWAVTVNNDLLIIPHTVDSVELAHTVLSQGEPVRAAGEADIAAYEGTFIGLSINNHSGHYMPDAASLDTGIKTFAEAGIIFADADKQRVGGR